MSEVIAWKCRDGHVLGLMTRDGSKRWYLQLYREALNMKPGAEHQEVELVGTIYGDATILCSQCGEKLTWIGDPAVIRKRLERLVKKGQA